MSEGAVEGAVRAGLIGASTSSTGAKEKIVDGADGTGLMGTWTSTVGAREGAVDGADGRGLGGAGSSVGTGSDSSGSVSNSSSLKGPSGDGVGTLSLTTVLAGRGLGGSDTDRTEGGNGISSGCKSSDSGANSETIEGEIDTFGRGTSGLGDDGIFTIERPERIEGVGVLALLLLHPVAVS